MSIYVPYLCGNQPTTASFVSGKPAPRTATVRAKGEDTRVVAWTWIELREFLGEPGNLRTKVSLLLDGAFAIDGRFVCRWWPPSFWANKIRALMVSSGALMHVAIALMRFIAEPICLAKEKREGNDMPITLVTHRTRPPERPVYCRGTYRSAGGPPGVLDGGTCGKAE